MAMHGFSFGALGLRTRSLGRVGRRGGASFVEAPFGGIAVDGDDESDRWLDWSARRQFEVLSLFFVVVESESPRCLRCLWSCEIEKALDFRPSLCWYVARCFVYFVPQGFCLSMHLRRIQPSSILVYTAVIEEHVWMHDRLFRSLRLLKVIT